MIICDDKLLMMNNVTHLSLKITVTIYNYTGRLIIYVYTQSAGISTYVYEESIGQ